MWQLNRLLCSVEIDGRRMDLDANVRSVPYPYLPILDCVEGGLLIAGTDSAPVNLWHPRRQNGIDVTIREEPAVDNSLTANVEILFRGYDQSRSNDLLRDSAAIDAFLNDILATDDYELVQSSVQQEPERDLTRVGFALRLPEYVTHIEQTLFVAPKIISLMNNPFEPGPRTYPIDFGYARAIQYDVTIVPPPSGQFTQMPDYQEYSESGMIVRRRVSDYKDSVRVITDLKINDPVLRPNLYGNVLKMFSALDALGRDEVVISVSSKGDE